jgi:hydrogenase expression/formation protein HypC
MCLSIPSKVVAIDEDNVATVDTMGVTRQVSLDLMADPVAIGEYVLIHVGYAMSRIDEEDALESLKVYREILEIMDEEQGEEGESRSERGSPGGLSSAQERDHLGGERERTIEADEKVNGEAREAPLGDNCPQRGET